MYGSYKEEFSQKETPGSNPLLKCFASYLWDKNEGEMLKKIVLAEAYKDSLPDHPDMNILSPDSTLMKALQNTFRGGEDYPKDTIIILTENEK